MDLPNPASVIDAVLEAPVVPSFTRLGYELRRRTAGWTDLTSYDLTGRVILLTGATSGLGRAAAERLAAAGATLILNGRNEARNTTTVAQLRAATGSESLSAVAADMGELDDVRALATRVQAEHPHLDVIIHNAGALSSTRRVNSAGLEATVASQVVGPFLLTHLLLDQLLAAPQPARVLTMSSGGMYTAGLTVTGLEMDEASYGGAEQYARAKRAQVTLNELWAGRHAPGKVVFHALHPGWADTPGVEEALPTFRRIVGPLLRSADQGADTMVWLAADDGEPLASSGDFWLDRRRRSIHKLPATRRTDTPARRAELWQWVSERAGTC